MVLSSIVQKICSEDDIYSKIIIFNTIYDKNNY